MEYRKTINLWLFALVTLLILTIAAFAVSSVKHNKEYEYYFYDHATYEKCKYLLKEKHEGYILYGTDKQEDQYVAYVRELIESEEIRNKEFFETEDELNEFVENETISVYEEIPPLQDGAKFNDQRETVTYYIHDTWPRDVFVDASDYIIYVLMIWSILNICAVLWYTEDDY